MAEESLTYAYLGSNRTELVYIDDPRILNGKNCDCTCPGCGSPVGAWNNGARQAHHFKHISGSDCGKGQMTALHKMAQQILCEHKTAMSPLFNGQYYTEPAKKFSFEEVIPEKTVILAEAKRRPDCIGKIGDETIWVEFLVTHKVDDKKVEQIETAGITCFEIDLSDWKDYCFSQDQLRDRIENEVEDRKWICNQNLTLLEKKAEAEEEARAKAELERQRQKEEQTRESIRADLSEKLLAIFNLHKVLVALRYDEICSKRNQCEFHDKSACRRQAITNICDYYDSYRSVERDNCKCAYEFFSQTNTNRKHLFIELYSSDESFADIKTDEKVIQISGGRHKNFINKDYPLNDRSRQKISVRLVNFEKKRQPETEIAREENLYILSIDRNGIPQFEKSSCSFVSTPLRKNRIFEIRIIGAREDYGRDRPLTLCLAIAYKNGYKIKHCSLCKREVWGTCKNTQAHTQESYAQHCTDFCFDEHTVDCILEDCKNIKCKILNN